MKILVINLDNQNVRLKFQQQQMARLGLEFDRLQASQIDDISPADMARQIHQWERPMRKGEVACLTSHRAAWQITLTHNEPVLVLEDDAYLSNNVPAILQHLESITGLDHVTLEVRGRKKILATTSSPFTGASNLTRLYQDRTGAGAYVIWPKGAKMLLARSDRAAGLADAIIAAAYEMSSWQIEPAPAMQLDQCDLYNIPAPIETSTSIGTLTDTKPKPENLLQNAIFKWRRVKSQLRMGLRQIFTITIARRRMVSVEISDFPTHIPPNNSQK